MKFHTHNDKEVITTLSSMQGYMQATQAELEEVFGVPHMEPSDSRTTRCWRVQFEDGTVAAIYDWITAPPSHLAPASWHIAGFDRESVQRVHDAFREVHGFKTRAVRAA